MMLLKKINIVYYNLKVTNIYTLNIKQNQNIIKNTIHILHNLGQ